MTFMLPEAHEMLARVRQNPFLAVSSQRIRERAYYLWLHNRTSLDTENWLHAEAVETSLAAAEQLVRSYDASNAVVASVVFDEAYHCVASWRFGFGQDATEAQLRTTLGTRSPRKCSICGRGPNSAPPATFRKVAHVVPESLGNRWLTTYDECDDCNSRFGRELEDDLGKMTLPDRAMNGVRSKRRTAKLKPKTKSSLGGGARGGPIIIQIHADDPAVSFSILLPPASIDPSSIDHAGTRA